MKHKVLALAMLVAIMCVSSHAYAWYEESYSYYSLPPGYHYEYRDIGTVIVEDLTGALMSYAILRALFPYHVWTPVMQPFAIRGPRVWHHPPMWHHSPMWTTRPHIRHHYPHIRHHR